MRLIDGDELVHNLKTAIDCGHRNDAPTTELEAVLSDVETMKSYPVTPVTPCHACAFGKQLTADGSVWCNKHGQVWPRNGFCSWGARNGDVYE